MNQQGNHYVPSNYGPQVPLHDPYSQGQQQPYYPPQGQHHQPYYPSQGEQPQPYYPPQGQTFPGSYPQQPQQYQQYHPPQPPIAQPPYASYPSQPQFEPTIIQANTMQPEGDSIEFFSPDKQSTRLGFIRKVYSILAIQLSLSAGLIALSIFYQPYQDFLLAQPWLIAVCAVVSIITLYALVCYQSVSRSVPTNYILLALFTASEAYLLSLTTSLEEPENVGIAAALTTAIVLALTLYAFTTSTDFTMCGGLLFVCAVLLFIGGLFSILFPSKIVETGLAALGALLFSVYLIYDTQLVVGRHEQALSLDDYIQGALMLYLDIIRIFLEILKLVAIANSSSR